MLKMLIHVMLKNEMKISKTVSTGIVRNIWNIQYFLMFRDLDS